MPEPIKKLTIEGYKSIRRLEDFPLRALNVLIGANGTGKSNFISFFRFLHEMVEQRLQKTVTVEGGADAFLHLGPQVTPALKSTLHFRDCEYKFALIPTQDNRFVFSFEHVILLGYHAVMGEDFGSGHLEGKLRKEMEGLYAPFIAYDSISNWVVYHFHDTSPTAAVKRPRSLNDNESFRQSGENLAPFLYRIQQTDRTSYSRIRDVVRLSAPFFDDFKLRPMPTSPDMIQLEWLQKDSDYPFRANQLSDGTLRFICMATALLQPSPPPTMLFDEPELGLHPYALTLLGNLFKQAAESSGEQVTKQLIVSTQSAPLLNEFAPEDIIVVERTNSESTFRRLNSADLSEWLEDYTLGELWQKNILGGRPREDRQLEPVPNGAPHQ